MSAPPTVGQTVPDFVCASTEGTFTYRAGQTGPLVLYFYPKDSTPGCTREGEDFRDHYEAFRTRSVNIIGVSRDSLASHERFRSKYALPFPLLADTDGTLCALFDVIKDKNMYGRQVRGIERSTFLIDAQGVLRTEWRKVKVAGHATAVLEALDRL